MNYIGDGQFLFWGGGRILEQPSSEIYIYFFQICSMWISNWWCICNAIFINIIILFLLCDLDCFFFCMCINCCLALLDAYINKNKLYKTWYEIRKLVCFIIWTIIIFPISEIIFRNRKVLSNNIWHNIMQF